MSLIIFMGISFLNAQERVPEVEELLKKMTLEEKIGQLNLLTPGGGVATGSVVSEDVETKIKEGNVGGVFGVSSPEKVRQAQKLAVENSRLGIPLLIGSDVIHGYKTTFPIPLGLSSSWDMDLIKETAQIAAKEATADGINWNFSPMVDIARDPRWGRIAEGAGEDPYLGSQVAKAMVEGYQGDDFTAPNTMIATVKHLALYGASEAGRDYNSVDMSKIKMFNEYLPPYKAAVDAGVASAMTSFNDIHGVPASGNKWLITDLFRERWGFEGFVVSDYTSVNEMIAHGMGDLQDVSALAINAGLDMDMVGEGFTTLKKSVEEGKVSEEQITKAARRILEAKHKLGLLDDPYLYSDESRPEKDILSEENRAVARKAAKRSFVLLKKHENTLPLAKDAKIALVGPLANNKNNMLGTWAPTGNPQLSVPVMEGIKNVAPNAEISYAKGANISNDTTFAKNVNVFGPRIEISEETPEAMIEEALQVSKDADVIVAVVGEATEMSGEAASRTNLNIPDSQKKLIRELVKTGKPVVLILMSGRPLVISEEMEMPVSILQVWHPGVEAGNAIADVLFGDYNPSGKLTATWPRNVGQIPIYYRMKTTGRPAASPSEFQKFKSNYLDVENTPQLPFGYGLSYTNFEYGETKASSDKLSENGSITITTTVTNTGDFDGEEVVQLYTHDKVRSITPPMKELKAFKKISLKKGETKEVSFELTAEDLKFYNADLEFVVEPGEFEFFVAGSSDHEFTNEFTVEE
ncbi:beta-glucosidase BglX [Salegentibacter sp. Hel_I_6]|uniref:beta-glucosidase BglX n=1 Tax=Salegentibacter sp. Hel_I_6 TaxID=1250278 RepID=UPI000ACEA223|nr:beta-glucosidase BglX [Salegentibacter sp. Hel_I_6]